MAILYTQVDINGNGIYDNKDHGIWCRSEADITENDILGNSCSAIHLITSNKAKVSILIFYIYSDCIKDIFDYKLLYLSKYFVKLMD